ncbi:MAG: hypothetical protein DCC55_08385 [Chloroflexi bacterium]|nr:MAG: hypothetical protein DCC55_08385 [Chloroflexota bacterium]
MKPPAAEPANQNLKNQAALSSIYMAVATIGVRLVSMLGMVFLARLLDPRDFGVVALAMLVFSTARLFTDLGMTSSVIYSRLGSDQVAFPAFVICMFTSLSFFTLVNVQPLLFANFLGNSTITPILHGLSLLIVLDGLSLVPEALLKKELKFGQISKAMLISNAVDSVVAVFLALFGFGLWSLVYGKLAGAFTQLVVIWFTCPGWDWLTPRPWNWSVARDLLQYGLKSTGGGFMNFFNSNWDDWLVGRVLGSTALGFYDKAYGLTRGILGGINTTVISAVLFPSLRKIQDDPERLSRAYIKGIAVSALIMAPLAMGTFAIAQELVPTLLGEKWIPMIPTLQIFTLMALVRPMASTTSPLFRAVGRPEFDLRVGLVVTVTMVPLVFLWLPYGIEGVALAVTVSYICGFIYNIYQIHQLLPGTAHKVVPAILPAVVAGTAMIFGVFSAKQPLRHMMLGQPDFVFVSGLVMLGGIIYIGVAFLIRRALIMELLHLFAAVTVPRLSTKRASS